MFRCKQWREVRFFHEIVWVLQKTNGVFFWDGGSWYCSCQWKNWSKFQELILFDDLHHYKLGSWASDWYVHFTLCLKDSILIRMLFEICSLKFLCCNLLLIYRCSLCMYTYLFPITYFLPVFCLSLWDSFVKWAFRFWYVQVYCF